jgi:hypothetical protein
MVFPTEFQIDLVFYQLIAAEDHTRLYLPHEKTVVRLHVVGDILLHRKIKGESANLLVLQCNV